MIYLNKYKQLEFWLYTATYNVFSCEKTESGLVWHDGNGWLLEGESLCEKLTKARAEALAKMPKRVEFETEIKDSHYIIPKGTMRLKFPTFDRLTCGECMLEFESDGTQFEVGRKVKVIIEEVQE